MATKTPPGDATTALAGHDEPLGVSIRPLGGTPLAVWADHVDSTDLLWIDGNCSAAASLSLRR